jgi:hypothetical protein
LLGVGGALVILTDYLAIGSTIAGIFGFAYEPLTGTTFFTDALTWALSDTFGLLMLAGSAFMGLVIVYNASSRRGDLFR